MWEFLAHPAERGTPDEFGDFDHSMLLGSAWPQLTLALLLTSAVRRGRRRVWGPTWRARRIAFSKGIASLGVRGVPCQMRHS